MSDAALTDTSKDIPKRPKYRPEIDGPRMKIYMADKRAKDKAGFLGTVKAWRDHLAKLGS